MSLEAVRAMMLIRLNSLCKGHSGIHPDCIRQLVVYLNNNVHPAIRESVAWVRPAIWHRCRIWRLHSSVKEV